MTAGWRTTEFWIAVLCIVGGVILLAMGKEDIGKWLIGIGAGGYVLSRGVAKIGGATKIVGVVLILGALIGCCQHHLPVDLVGGTMLNVCTTQDELLTGKMDPKDLNGDGVVDAKDELRRRVFLRDSELTRAAIEEARK